MFKFDGFHRKSVNKKSRFGDKQDLRFFFFFLIIQVVSQLKFCGIDWVQPTLRCWEKGAAAEPGGRI